MELTIPKLLSIPFADEGQKNDIPNIVTAPSSNLASYRDGFPAVTMVPRAAGGQPPLGQDMNGVLNEITSHTVFQNIGGQYRFDAELVAAIGGYPKGVVLQANTGDISYISLEDNNTENFNTVEEITKWRIYNAFPATEALAGIARIATASEVEAGVNDDAIITPAKLASALFDFVKTADFTGANQLLELEGWQEFPGGLILQWGYRPTGSNPVETVTFHFPFTAPVPVQATAVNAEAAAAANSTGETTATTTRIRRSLVGANYAAFHWFAYGKRAS